MRAEKKVTLFGSTPESRLEEITLLARRHNFRKKIVHKPKWERVCPVHGLRAIEEGINPNKAMTCDFVPGKSHSWIYSDRCNKKLEAKMLSRGDKVFKNLVSHVTELQKESFLYACHTLKLDPDNTIANLISLFIKIHSQKLHISQVLGGSVLLKYSEAIAKKELIESILLDHEGAKEEKHIPVTVLSLSQ